MAPKKQVKLSRDERFLKGLELLERGEVKKGGALLDNSAFDKNHAALKHYMILNAYKKENEGAIKILIELGDYEKKAPSLALKAYCFIGEEEKVKELLEAGADPNCQQITYQNALADALSEDRKNIVATLIEHNKHEPINARTAMLRACNNNLVNSLDYILKNKNKLSITQSDLRDCAYHCITKNNYKLFALVCSHACPNSILTWKTHMEAMEKEAKLDSYKRRYHKELGIISEEILKRKVKKSVYDPCSIEI